MPSSIPYDPSLVLANVVSNAALNVVQEISSTQAPVDAAQESLNALLASRRSLDMTMTELRNLSIDTKVIDKELCDLNKEIASSAASYATTKIVAEKKIRELRSKIPGVHVQVESPVDYTKTHIKSMPLASDSLNMDVQYFSMDTEDEKGSSHADTISSFVSNSTSWMGSSASSQMSSAAQKQVSRQAKKHSVAGTLVISVSCTHKNASVLAPFALNIDKGVKVWNRLFPKDKLNVTNRCDMMRLALTDEPECGGNKFSIVSGMTYGSSFVGMVHVLNTSDTTVGESLSSYASTLQAQMDAGAWFESASGGFGVNDSIANDVKNLLSAQNVSSHVTVICMGVIPSLVASEVKIGVEKFAKFDPQSSLSALATVQHATVSDQGTVKESADAARTGQQMITMKAGEVKAALSALAEIDDGANKMLDINSMMTALDDYLKKATEGNSGIPINYYLKDITKSMLAEMWVAKYYPRYMQISYDDVAPSKPSQPSADAGSGNNNSGGNTSGNTQ